jgi:serine/threonine protein kinase
MAVDAFGLAGQVIDAQLRVDEAVGEGGFSVVYRGYHLGLDEPVAIKCLKLSAAIDASLIDSFIRRFRDESRICYRLSRGNLDIVRSITSGTTTTPRGVLLPYMALEWLEGRSLADDLRERRAKKLEGRPLEEMVALLDPAANAIAYAHAEGVVHRDLKPGNLFVCTTREGTRLKVLDFGLAKILHDDVLGTVPLKTGKDLLLFSPSYGAPEQLDPKLGAVGPWTDVYALAIVLLELLRDKKVRSIDAVGGVGGAVIQALDPRDRPTPRRYGVPIGEEVEAVMARAVALRPEERPRNVGEFWRLLHDAMHRDGATSLAKTAENEVATVAARARSAVDLEMTARDGLPAFASIQGDPAATLRIGDTRRANATPSSPPAPRAPLRDVDDGTGTLVMDRPNFPRPASVPAPPPAPSRAPRGMLDVDDLEGVPAPMPAPLLTPPPSAVAASPPAPPAPPSSPSRPSRPGATGMTSLATPIAMSTPAGPIEPPVARGSRLPVVLLLILLVVLAAAAFAAQRSGLLGHPLG